jgi:hypothetical protein
LQELGENDGNKWNEQGRERFKKGRKGGRKRGRGRERASEREREGGREGGRMRKIQKQRKQRRIGRGAQGLNRDKFLEKRMVCNLVSVVV